MDFIPNTKDQQKEMLEVIGVSSVQELFADIPEQGALKELLNIPAGKPELEVRNKLVAINNENRTDVISFLGAGCYNHFVPAVVNHLAGRSEFLTAYTPYQGEVSQGSLQVLFEFQTLICQITGMDAANASMYDGASALAESCTMCVNITGRNQIIISSAIHPDYKQVVRTYANARGLEICEIEFDDEKGSITADALKDKISDETAGVLIQNPNFFGNIEDLKMVADITHENSAVFVVCVVEPTSSGLIKSPGDCDADIVVGEGQSLGLSMNFGGPFLGFMAVKDKYLRQMPGRLVGTAKDAKGNDGFILTLQAREQHIRREKASSNICTSQVLCAIAATIYMSALGKSGFKELAQLNLQKAHYAYEKIRDAGFKPKFRSPFYNEFVFQFDNIDEVNKVLLKNGIVGGVSLEQFFGSMKGCMLFCVTEIISKDDIDKLVEVLITLL